MTSTMIDDAQTPSTTRRERILDAAAQTFAANGYHAASLRDIAKAADCSLTLLDHHFGNKAELLKAVIRAQHDNCQKQLAPLRALSMRPGFTIEEFVSAWAHYEFDLHDTRSGRQYLALMLRLQADGEVDESRRATLNCSEPVVMQGFARTWTELDEAARIGLWRMASAALYAAVTSVDDVRALGETDSPMAVRGRAIEFLLHGLRGYCDGRPDRSAG